MSQFKLLDKKYLENAYLNKSMVLKLVLGYLQIYY